MGLGTQHPLGDANGDGVIDVGVVVVEDQSPYFVYHLLSGVDGTTIWSNSDFQPSSLGPWFAPLPDQDGDGVDELIVFERMFLSPVPNPGRLRVLSGRDGSTIWLRTIGDEWRGWPPTESTIRFYLDVLLGDAGDVDGDGWDDVLLEGWERPLGGESVPKLWTYSGRNGELLRREGWPDSLEPWLPGGRSMERTIRSAWRVGDVDGDGWPEVGVTARTEGYPLGTSHLVVAGRRTLSLPGEARIGRELRAKVWIPAGAGKEYQLLASTEFRNDGTSFHAGDWDTHLGLNDLLRRSATRPWARGTLDSSGQASSLVRVPLDGCLIGETIYSIVVVKDPSKPDGILTLSTMAQTAIR